MEGGSLWQSIVDPSTGSTYYANTQTGETTWTRPAELDSPASNNAQPAPTAAAATVTPAEPGAASGDASGIVNIEGTNWSKVWDVSSGQFYYANQITYEVDWNVPAEVAAAEAKAKQAGESSQNDAAAAEAKRREAEAAAVASATAIKAAEEAAAKASAEAKAAEEALAKARADADQAASLAAAKAPSVTPAPLSVPEEVSTPIQSVPSSTAASTSSTPAHRGSVNAYVKPAEDFGITHDYDRVLDQASGAYYYVQKGTNVTTWSVPESWQKVQEMEKKRAEQMAAAAAAASSHTTIPLHSNRPSFSTAPGSLNESLSINASTAERRGSTSGHAPSKSLGEIEASAATLTINNPNDPNSRRPSTMRGGPPPLPKQLSTTPHLQQPSNVPSRTISIGSEEGLEGPIPIEDSSSAAQTPSSRLSRAPPPLPIGMVPPSPSNKTPSKLPPALPGSLNVPSTSTPSHRSSTSGIPSPLFASPGASPSVTPLSTPKLPVQPRLSVNSPASNDSASSSSLAAPQAPHLRSSISKPAFAPLKTTLPSLGPDGKPVLGSAIKDSIHQFALKSFATNHFRTHQKKTGFLSRANVEADELLSWQKAPIQKSLLTSSKKYSSDAVAIFKKILLFCGDDPGSKKNPAGLATEIVGIGIKQAPLRDEIYCQLCKQTKANPEPLSCAAAWRLMALASSSFPPTLGFQEYLRKYFLENYASFHPPEAGILSRYCEWKMLKTIKEGTDEKLTLAAVEDMGRNGVKSNTVLFPGNLEYIVWCQSYEKNSVSTTVPELMIQMCNLIRKNGGFHAKGIFRIAAQREHIQNARAKIEQGKWSAVAESNDPHTPADVLKVWLRELVIPLIPTHLYDQCLKVCDSEQDCLELVHRELGNVPSHFQTLDYLLTFLAELATHQSDTMMNEENLAIVFSQDILRTSEKDPMVLFKNSPREIRFTRHLISAYMKKNQEEAAASAAQ